MRHRTLRWLVTFVTLVGAAVFVYAQNPFSLVQLGSTLVDTNSGNKSAGTLRVVLATDQPQTTLAVKVDGSAVTQPVSGTFWQATQPISAAALPLPTGASTETTLAGVLTISDFDSKTGSLTETAPATDTASSGLNGRLQRIAQRLTTVNTTLGSPFQAGGALGAGSAIIGKFTTDQTTHGTTDLVADDLVKINGTAIGQTNPLPTVFPGTLVSGAVTSAMTGTTTTSVVSGTGSNYLYITNCVVSNGSTTVSTDISLQDGSGGTTLYVLPAPAAATASTGGAGSVTAFPVPLKVPTSGNALYAANVTTGSSTKISCSGFRSTVSY